MSTDLFPSALAPLPEPNPNPGLLMIPSPPTPAPPRFVDGIDAFVAFVDEHDGDPAALAVDFSALWVFIAAHAEILAAPALAESATRFLGNAICVAIPAATWRRTPGVEVGTRTRSVPVADLLRMIVEHPERRAAVLETFPEWEQQDRDDAELTALTDGWSGPDVAPSPMPFVRPPLPHQEFRDDAGDIIEYGHRWPDHQPPEEAYSRVTHPERFAPLLLVADALIEHLGRWYEVEVDRQVRDDGTEVVRLRPSTGAALTLTTSPEAVHLEAGALFRETAPDCNCDACDDSVEDVAGHLEELILSIVGGGLRERYPLGSRRWMHTQLRTVDGTGQSSSSEPDPQLTVSQLQKVEEVLRDLDDGWWPVWTPRTEAAGGDRD